MGEWYIGLLYPDTVDSCEIQNNVNSVSDELKLHNHETGVCKEVGRYGRKMQDDRDESNNNV